MAIITPRLNFILKTLLAADRPISVDTLSTEMDVSRRTVFRELKNADELLNQVGLKLDTRVGEGLILAGEPTGYQGLERLLDGNRAMPKNKEERRVLLAFILMDNEEMQKLYYFASILDVSESTISLDMDALEPRLRAMGLELIRRQGVGAELRGPEEKIRDAALELIHSLDKPEAFIRTFDHPARSIYDQLTQLLQGEFLPLLDWMTDDSLAELILQLSVAVDRIQRGCLLDEGEEKPQGLPAKLAAQLCDAIESSFSLVLPKAERTGVAGAIRGCRAKQLNPLDIDDVAAFAAIQKLTLEMIEAFDPELAPRLKINEDLINNLSVHLWSAVVRLKKGIALSSDVGDQLRREFPEIYDRTLKAVTRLEDYIETPVPAAEAALIAVHFGAAIMHLGQRTSRPILLKAGLVCVSGIGVSYMMASQIGEHFRGELEVSISDWNNPEEWQHYDLLISSFPLDYEERPVVTVNPILTQRDYEAIRSLIKTTVKTLSITIPKGEAGLAQRLDKVRLLFHELAPMMESFSGISVRDDITMAELIELAGNHFGEEAARQSQIIGDLSRREAISTQVIPQLGIVLLHAKTEGVDHPVLAMLSPADGGFTDASLSGAKGCVLMLLPKASAREFGEVLGCISQALVEDEVLLSAVHRGDEALAYTRIENALQVFLQKYWSDHFKF